MWRHEDVWRTLGGGIDFLTGERVEDECELAKAAADGEPSMGLVLAPLMHGAAQWATLGGLFKGVTNVVLPRFDPHLVWQAVQDYRIAVVTITGDAMAIPLIDALRERTYDTSALVAISSTAAVFSPVVKDQLFDLLPDVVHQRGGRLLRGRVQRPAPGGAGEDRRRRRRRGPDQRAAGPRFDHHRRRRPPGGAR